MNLTDLPGMEEWFGMSQPELSQTPQPSLTPKKETTNLGYKKLPIMGASMDYPEEMGMEAKEAPRQPTPTQCYCPVFMTENPDRSRTFTSYIEGAINDVDQYVNLIDVLMFGANENDKGIIYLDSQGGMIASGGLIASAIHHSKANANIRTDARGMCASSAALIHSAARKGNAVVSPMAIMMYHMSSHFDGGVSTKIGERAENQVRYVNECLLNKAVDEGHITKEEFDKIQNGKEIFVSAAEFNRRIEGDGEVQQETNPESIAPENPFPSMRW